MKTRRRCKPSHAFRLAALAAVACVLGAALVGLCLLRSALNTDAAVAVAALSPPPAVFTTPGATATLAPTPEPLPIFSFVADDEAPPPSPLEEVAYGVSRFFDGVISCNYPLTQVTALIVRDYCEDPFYPYMASVSFDPGEGVTAYRLSDGNTLEGVSLSSQLDLGALKVGVHTLILTGVCAHGALPSGEALSLQFYVLSDHWQRVEKDLFSNGSYNTALDFFSGDTDRFLYRFQNGFGRYTVADPAWESRYITEFVMDEGEPWRIHVDAVPHYEQVLNYLDSTHVRVHGANGDTGVLPLRQLIVAYHGSYVSRFTSAKLRYYSHHGLGTATDVNATMEPNMNTSANRDLIQKEVGQLLDYNGILSEAGVSYYDFTYSGSYPCTDFGVPESVINYLLFELAFYRAGFAWGHYYNSTSDAMHFVLTDNMPHSHEGGSRGLRKVYEYYN